MAVTIKDLARETGLTPATISAYFNGGNLRSYNRMKIERAIEKHSDAAPSRVRMFFYRIMRVCSRL